MGPERGRGAGDDRTCRVGLRQGAEGDLRGGSAGLWGAQGGSVLGGPRGGGRMNTPGRVEMGCSTGRLDC